MIYFDTAYVVKCYVPEPGAAEVRRLAGEAGRIACCTFGRAELAAALHRQRREGRLTPAAARAIVSQIRLDDQRRVIHWLPLTDDLCRKVSLALDALPADAFVRAGDAIHLVCAREAGFADVYSSDRHLLAAASFFGLVGRNVLAQHGDVAPAVQRTSRTTPGRSSTGPSKPDSSRGESLV